MTFNFINDILRIGGDGTATHDLKFYGRGFRIGEQLPPQPTWQDIVLAGIGSLTLTAAKADSLYYVKAFGASELEPETYIDSAIAEGKCEQRNVPAGYTEYDGLIGDGTAYIDLNCALDQDDEIEIEFTKTSDITSSNLCGGRTSATSNNISAIISSTGSIVGDFNNSDYSPYRMNVSISQNVRYRVVINKTGRYVYQVSDDSLVGSNTTACEDTILTPGCYLFNLAGTGLTSKFKGVIHKCLIKGKRDVVPVGNGTAYGMYDKLNGVFYPNANISGEFTVSTEVLPSPATPLNIVCNNGVLKCSPNLCNVISDNITLSYYISAQGQVLPSTQNFIYNKYIKVKPNTTYSLGVSQAVYFMSISEYSTADDTGFIRRTAFSSGSAVPYIVTSGTITTTANTNYLRFGSNMKSADLTLEDVLALDYMLTETATAQSYMPYAQIYTDGTVEAVKDSLNNTATCSNLFAVGDYKDTQEVLSGAITRRIGIKVLDGTETGWTKLSGANYVSLPKTAIPNMISGTDATCLSNNFVQTPHSSISLSTECFSVGVSYMNFKKAGDPTVAQFQQWLADQYNAGTPVIVVYPTSSTTTETVTGQVLLKAPLTVTGSINNLIVTPTTSSHTVQSAYQPLRIKCNNGLIKVNNQGSIYVDGTVETVKDGLDNTATVQNLYALSNVKDSQEILSGDVSRIIGVQVFDGTETWTVSGYASNCYYRDISLSSNIDREVVGLCTHFPAIAGTNTMPDMTASGCVMCGNQEYKKRIYFRCDKFPTSTDFKAFLAEQYAKGTPVMVLYAKTNASTSQVTPQVLSNPAGDSIIEITQASLNNLSLETKFQQEVTD